MDINRIIMCVMAFGAALGGLDSVLNNRFGLGSKFEDGFRMLGPVGLSMAGIICLAPVLSRGLGAVVRPVCSVIGIDPGIFGGVLAIDMGGYALAMDLAGDPQLGRFAGIVVSALFGCTVVFSIPVGMGFLREGREDFTRGILLGVAAMPAGLILGGVMMGLKLGAVLWNCLPILLLSGALAQGIRKTPQGMMKGFLLFAGAVRIVATLGLTIAAVSHMTGVTLVEGMPPVQEAMEVVCSICIVMLGSMPLAELLQRLLKKPFQWLGERTGLNGASTTALLVGLVSATPALALLPQMNRRGRVVVSAFLVSGISVFGAHFAFAQSVSPETVPALLAAKLLGGLMGGAIALACTAGENAAYTMEK